ncbi:aspartate carbamoyltransferase catalytic subunit [Syntrophomonas wolfei]|uniref:Aspartate carbamoyltransferase catalytic subunit n=1 Tax=Syntrophomonas wolfei subsp. wolfei (strain DSM 2245B / Goettingen) TaxID=335541 RepID=PYRB_SYNWW|nr:aspartate carbamoyltransferase catalytic subunit [Syntrophomonas wolfei]Q0AXG1.1 RecName: Full=Aspartate carbamoyltransferase catalytic subunit; AltName: Full=Aspartate transcarbamylase; Short=ATCase [Syntrophomonas wolfei subsp. wolfei str. Goettingen G311]ABI68593.1 aspartate carbamoyltransferase [Syntrophomonas wolfei subsp. wolfei str. Goettingen G311]
MKLDRKDLLGLRDLSREETELILNTAIPMKDVICRDIKKVPTLRGKALVTVFYENSTRTRTSFELAGKYLSADTVNLSVSTSSVQKGESLRDTIKTIEVMGFDLMVMRHAMSGTPHYVARNTRMRVINAGDGANEHPTQALLDMYTIKEKKGTLESLKVAIVGDILHSRVARSNIYGLSKFGCDIRVVGPATLMPPGIEKLGVKSYYSLDEAINGVDVINILRIQRERQVSGLFPSLDEYAQLYMLSPQTLARAKDDVLVLHPGPINRGVEISSELADSAQALINEQVTNGVAIRMALLFLMMGGGRDEITY